MKKRFTEEQIVKSVSRMKSGTRANELARELGVSQVTLYKWKKKYRDMNVSEAKRLRELESENTRLKRIVADLTLDNTMLRDVNSRKW